MQVYRVCNKKEYSIIMKTKNCSIVGSEMSNSNFNSHYYMKDKKYMHFFSNFDDILYLNLRKDYYICIYDIPDDLLNISAGIGYYYDFIEFDRIVSAEEYSIESNDIKFDYLIKAYRINEYLDFEDFIYGDVISKCEQVYEKDRELKYEKKLY